MSLIPVDSLKESCPHSAKMLLKHRKQRLLFLCVQSPQEQTPPSVLAALANGFAEREQEPAEPTHKIRVDFKVDIHVSLQNV